MKSQHIWYSILLAIAHTQECKWYDVSDMNPQPIIGIVSQPLTSYMAGKVEFDGTDSYIMKAYVEFMESAGARVIPLILGEPWETTLAKLEKINGVLFPGGSGSYQDFGGQIFDQLKTYNEKGQVYPAWGTCLGYEYMCKWVASSGNPLSSYVAHNSTTIEFIYEPSQSKMWREMGNDALNWETNPMALQSHNYGVNPDKFTTDAGLNSFFRLTSIAYSTDTNEPFANTIEAYDYPFFGTAFHPEKTMAVFYEGKGINHSWESIRMNRYFADKFISYARQNRNYWGNFQEVQGAIIQNCRHVVLPYSSYTEVYAFNAQEGCIP